MYYIKSELYNNQYINLVSSDDGHHVESLNCLYKYSKYIFCGEGVESRSFYFIDFCNTKSENSINSIR